MNNPLDEACDVLNEFDQEIAKVKAFWEQLAEDNPHFEQVSTKNWQEKHHRMWLHGAIDVSECNELERWLYGDLPATKIAQSPALGIYKAWRKWLKTAGIPKFKTSYA